MLCPASHAQDTEAVNRLSGILAQTTTLSAEVEQLQMDQDGRELQETRARLVMRKPASFAWTVLEPWEEFMVTDGTTIWRYEPDLDQVTIQPFVDDVDRTPVMLLNGDAETIAASYDVTMAQLSGQYLRFILLPRRPDRLFERLSLTFNGAVLEEMQFEDSLGQQTSLSFHGVTRNQPIDAATFDFEPPPGVEIIDNRP